MKSIKERLERTFNECDKHLLRINQANDDILVFFPLSVEKYENLSKNQIQAIDQYLFRFSKLQDAMGEKIFRLLLQWVEEDIQKLPFIDILNQLEKYQIIENAETWLYLRNLRNEIAHQYDDEPLKMTDSLNLIFKEKETIETIYLKIKNYYNTRKNL